MKNLAIKGDISNATLVYMQIEVQKILLDLEKNQYALHINSTGGEINPAIETGTLLQGLGNRIIGFGHEVVASSALLIHQSCLGDRIATPTTRFLLHGIQPPPGKSITEQHRKSEFFIFEHYATMTGRTLEQIYALAAKNKYINAKEALDFGFITKIIEYPFPTF